MPLSLFSSLSFLLLITSFLFFSFSFHLSFARTLFLLLLPFLLVYLCLPSLFFLSPSLFLFRSSFLLTTYSISVRPMPLASETSRAGMSYSFCRTHAIHLGWFHPILFLSPRVSRAVSGGSTFDSDSQLAHIQGANLLKAKISLKIENRRCCTSQTVLYLKTVWTFLTVLKACHIYKHGFNKMQTQTRKNFWIDIFYLKVKYLCHELCTLW